MSKDYVSTQEAGRLCSVDRRTVLRWVDAGLLPSFQTGGGRNRIRKDDLIRFMRDRGMPIPQALDAGPRRVLIVDDDLNHVAAMRRLVERTAPDAEIHEATDGFSAGIVVKSFLPHVMLLDIVMPGMNGIEVCRRIRTDRDLDGVRIIVISGIITPSLERELLELGADGCHTKPVNPQALVSVLREYLNPTAGSGWGNR